MSQRALKRKNKLKQINNLQTKIQLNKDQANQLRVDNKID